MHPEPHNTLHCLLWMNLHLSTPLVLPSPELYSKRYGLTTVQFCCLVYHSYWQIWKKKGMVKPIFEFLTIPGTIIPLSGLVRNGAGAVYLELWLLWELLKPLTLKFNLANSLNREWCIRECVIHVDGFGVKFYPVCLTVIILMCKFVNEYHWSHLSTQSQVQWKYVCCCPRESELCQLVCLCGFVST